MAEPSIHTTRPKKPRGNTSRLATLPLLTLLASFVISFGASLCAQQSPAPPTDELVAEVRVVGSKAVPVEKIRREIHTRKGRPFSMELLENDVRRLNRTGLFVNVKPYTQVVAGGRLVVFEVYERPLLHYVRYVGNSDIKTKLLAKQAELKTGDAMDPFAVEQAAQRIKSFYQSKGYSNVHVTVAEGSKVEDRGAVFVINEGRKQRVLWTNFVGNKIASDGKLRTQIQSKPGVFWFIGGEVDREKIDGDVDRLTAYYRSLGYFKARVGRELSFNEKQNWLTITFVVDEGPRYSVRDVRFIGNKVYGSEDLLGDLKLRGNQPFHKGDMDVDVAAVREKYGSVGYVFANVEPDMQFMEDTAEVDLVYRVDEGDRYRVGKIDVEIVGEYPHTKVTAMLNRFSLKPGDIVDIRKIRESEIRMQRSGLFKVEPQNGIMPKIVFSPPEMDEEESQVAGRPHRTNFRGQSPRPKAYRPVVRCQSGYSVNGGRSMPTLPPSTPYNYSSAPATTTSPGTAYPPSGVSGGSASMPRTAPSAPAYGNQGGYYAPGTVTAAPAPGQIPINEGVIGAPGYFAPGSAFNDAGDEEPLRDLAIKIRASETQTGRLMFGVGVNSDAGLMGNIVVDEQNFDWTRWPRSWEDIRNATAWRGAGQRLRIEAVPGTLVQRYMITFQEPYLLDTRISLGLSGFYFDRRYRYWWESRKGGRVSLGYQLSHDLTCAFAFRGEEVAVHHPYEPTPPELTAALGDSALYGFRFQLTHDTRDSAFMATQGHLFEMSFEQVVGTYQYPRVELDVRRNFLLKQHADRQDRHVLTLKGRAGYTGANTPIYDHFFAGGYSTIRGFDFRGVAPISGGIQVGGEFMLLASAEYSFPVTADGMLRGAFFCDTGTVQRTLKDWNDAYRVAPGFGLRIKVPAMGPAPISLDFAFPISAENGDREEVFSFWVGMGG